MPSSQSLKSQLSGNTCVLLGEMVIKYSTPCDHVTCVTGRCTMLICPQLCLVPNKLHSTVLDAFAEFIKLMNYTELWDANLAIYSTSAAHRFCLYGLEHSFWIHSFRPTRHYLILKIFATQVKFLEPFGYFSVINCTFHLSHKCFCLLLQCYSSVWTYEA